MAEALGNIQKNALFVGLITLDLIYLVDRFPDRNQKIVANEQIIAAGGPATNAAITFSYLGDRSTLLGVLGNGFLSDLIRAELENYAVELIDLDANCSTSVPVSSIVVTRSTGERAVISVNATKSTATIDNIPINLLENIDLVAIDGHQMQVSALIAKIAKDCGIPVAIDGGSWKLGWEQVLPLVDYAICSADFCPPDCQNKEDVFAYLQSLDIPYIAITNGKKAIEYLDRGRKGIVEIPQVQVVDTLGAGDIFHGAFYHYILQQEFPQALRSAAIIAANSCQFFGTRSFTNQITSPSNYPM